MLNVQDEYVGKHRLERPDGEVALGCSGWDARDKIRSAMRGVPNDSPRHAYDPAGPFTAAAIDARQKLLNAKRAAS